MEVKFGAEEATVEEDHLPATHLVNPDDEEHENRHAELGLEMRQTGLSKIQYQRRTKPVCKNVRAEFRTMMRSFLAGDLLDRDSPQMAIDCDLSAFRSKSPRIDEFAECLPKPK